MTQPIPTPPAHLLLIECYAEFEADLVDVLLDAGDLVDRFSVSPVRLYGRDLPLPSPRDRVVGSRAGLRAVVAVQRTPGGTAGDAAAPLTARLRHHLGRAGLVIQDLQGQSAPLAAEIG